MNVRNLKDLIKDLPDDLPVHVNDEQAGKYSENVQAFHFKGDAEDSAALIIAVGEEE